MNLEVPLAIVNHDVRDFHLGLETDVSSLNDILSRDQLSGSDTLQVNWSSNWFDLALLLRFGQILRSASSIVGQVELLSKPSVANKHSFLASIGFWDFIGLNNKKVKYYPSPYGSNSVRPANFNQIQGLELSQKIQDGMVADFVRDWDTGLASCSAYDVVSDSEAFQTKEYLYLLMWELVQNARLHSHGTEFASVGQIFLSRSDIDAHARVNPGWIEDNRVLANRLAGQHLKEANSSKLPLRSKWLSENSESSFLMLVCCDDGIGIPASLRSSNSDNLQSSDSQLLELGFSPWSSTRRKDPEHYDVHGLSQILRLVREHHGYLVVQSGTAILEAYNEKFEEFPDVPATCGGTLFQILLPLNLPSDGKLKSGAVIARSSAKGIVDEAPVERSTIVVAGEIKRIGVELPVPEHEWTRVASHLIEQSDKILSDPLILDMINLPLDRQFTSLLLRSLRRARSPRAIVALNVPDEILAVARYMPSVDEPLQIPSGKYEQVNEIHALDLELGKALGRGQFSGLPLLLPVCSATHGESIPSPLWLGLGLIPNFQRAIVETALTHLFVNEGNLVSWNQLYQVATKSFEAPPSEKSFQRILRTIARCNPSLFKCTDEGGVSLFSRVDLEFRSIASLRRQAREFSEKMEHPNRSVGDKFLYSLSWHSNSKRFRKKYYQTWPVLSLTWPRNVFATLLVAQGYMELGAEFGDISAVICVTPSAGLLGREVAALLNVPFYEVSSLYEIERSGWLPRLVGNVTVVNDVLDSGVLTTSLVKRLKHQGLNIRCVLACLENKGGTVERQHIGKIISCVEVDLGDPTELEISKSLKNVSYYEVDPHTLIPVPPKSEKLELLDETSQNRLRNLAENGSLRSGHFVHGGHHYDLYFSLIDALAAPSSRSLLLEWLLEKIEGFAQSSSVRSVTIVYPYYSPVYRLVSRLLAYGRLHSEVELNSIVAMPTQLSGGRLGYRLARTGELLADITNVVVLDDGVATGGTLAAILDELVANNAKNALALVAFDRIGLQARRHLRNIEKYRTRKGRMKFDFETFVSVNVRSYFEDNCPDCSIRHNIIDRCRGHDGFLASAVSVLEGAFEETIVGAERVKVASRLSAEEVASVIAFRHSVLSDTPSPRELELSLSGREGACRLECLLTILFDPKLFRQYPDWQRLGSWIVDDFSVAGVSTETRVRFILAVSQISNREFSHLLFSDVLPRAYEKLTIVSDGKYSAAGANRYFDENQAEFFALGATYFVLLETMNMSASNENDMLHTREWERLLATSSLYLFHFRSLEVEPTELPSVEAEHLVANFCGSFAEHSEGYLKRLQRCRVAINEELEGLRNKYMPLELFNELIGRIERTQNNFQEWVLTHEQIDGLRRFSSETGGYSAAQFAKCITDTFLGSRTNRKMTPVDILLSRIAPKPEFIVKSAQQIFGDRNPNRKPEWKTLSIDDDLENYRVLGSASYLAKVLANLQNNVLEAWRRRKRVHSDTPEVMMHLKIRIESKVIVFSIEDNIPSDGPVEDFFSATSALATHRAQLMRWGGNLEMRSVDRDRKIAELTLKKIVIDRDLKDPNDDTR